MAGITKKMPRKKGAAAPRVKAQLGGTAGSLSALIARELSKQLGERGIKRTGLERGETAAEKRQRAIREAAETGRRRKRGEALVPKKTGRQLAQEEARRKKQRGKLGALIKARKKRKQ